MVSHPHYAFQMVQLDLDLKILLDLRSKNSYFDRGEFHTATVTLTHIESSNCYRCVAE